MRFSTSATTAACVAALLYLSAPVASAAPTSAPAGLANAAKAGDSVEKARYRRHGRYGHRRYGYRRFAYPGYGYGFPGYGYGYGYRRPYYGYYGGGYDYPYYYYRRRPGVSLYFGF